MELGISEHNAYVGDPVGYEERHEFLPANIFSLEWMDMHVPETGNQIFARPIDDPDVFGEFCLLRSAYSKNETPGYEDGHSGFFGCSCRVNDRDVLNGDICSFWFRARKK